MIPLRVYKQQQQQQQPQTFTVILPITLDFRYFVTLEPRHNLYIIKLLKISCVNKTLFKGRKSL